MQRLTAPPRDGLTAAQVTALLAADSVEIAPGLELLDSADEVVADISDDLADGEVKYQADADVQRTCHLSIGRELSWATDRVRPYLTMTDPVAGVSARFNLGVYLLTVPQRAAGEDPTTFDADGVDKLALLQPIVGDTYVVSAETAYLDAVRAAIAAAGAGSRVALDGTASAKTLPEAMVWALADSDQATWLDVVNDLLAAIGYGRLWVDQDGYFRAEPYATPATRGVEWAFSVDDARTSIVGQDRVEKVDHYQDFNSWRFIRRQPDTAPTEGAGVYTVTDADAIAANGGRVAWRVEYLDAADQEALVAQGNAIAQGDRQSTRSLDITTGPLPIAGHLDVVTFADAALGGVLKAQAATWTLPLDGSDMTWTLEVL